MVGILAVLAILAIITIVMYCLLRVADDYNEEENNV